MVLIKLEWNLLTVNSHQLRTVSVALNKIARLHDLLVFVVADVGDVGSQFAFLARVCQASFPSLGRFSSDSNVSRHIDPDVRANLQVYLPGSRPFLPLFLVQEIGDCAVNVVKQSLGALDKSAD